MERLAKVPKLIKIDCTLYNIEIGEAQLMDSKVVVPDASVAHTRAPIHRTQSSCNTSMANTLCNTSIPMDRKNQWQTGDQCSADGKNRGSKIGYTPEVGDVWYSTLFNHPI